LRDLGHLDAGRQAQLVPGDVRAGDRADHLRIDVEVAERLGQLAADPRDPLGVELLGAVGALQEAVPRERVVDVVGLRYRAAPVALRCQLVLSRRWWRVRGEL